MWFIYHYRKCKCHSVWKSKLTSPVKANLQCAMFRCSWNKFSKILHFFLLLSMVFAYLRTIHHNCWNAKCPLMQILGIRRRYIPHSEKCQSHPVTSVIQKNFICLCLSLYVYCLMHCLSTVYLLSCCTVMRIKITNNFPVLFSVSQNGLELIF